jgi:hypothetical protein
VGQVVAGVQGSAVLGAQHPLHHREHRGVEKARTFLLGYPGVTAIRELLFTFVGPGRVMNCRPG